MKNDLLHALNTYLFGNCYIQIHACHFSTRKVNDIDCTASDIYRKKRVEDDHRKVSVGDPISIVDFERI